MNGLKKLLLLMGGACMALLSAPVAIAKLKVVATTTTLAEMARQIGGEDIDVLSITKRGQDPHFVEAKPSYMVRLRRADLLVSVGLGLEVGWIDLVRRGARNPKILPGRPGHFSSGEHMSAIEIPEGKVDRADGDVHPEGNPHFHLDPIRFLQVSEALLKKINELDPEKSEEHTARWKEFKKKIEAKHNEWSNALKGSGVKKVVAYHKSFNYFFDRYGLVPVDYLEPKPGVSPTAKHIVGLIRRVKKEGVSCILNEDYFEETAARRVKSATHVSVVAVPVEVQSTYINLINKLVAAVKACAENRK